MTSKKRLAALEKDLQLSEAAYEERLTGALRMAAGGHWGLFGTNDAAYEAHFGAKNALRSKEAQELFERGGEIAALRERLGYADAFMLHERYLAYRKLATDPNAPGEPKLAERFFNEIVGKADDPHKAWKKLYKEFYEWLVQRFDEWDPQGLLCEDNPGREYGPEVSRILPLLRTAVSEEELASRIHGVFVEMFDEQMAGSTEDYRSISKAILDEWRVRTEALAGTVAETNDDQKSR